jgi:hypothetical protein
MDHANRAVGKQIRNTNNFVTKQITKTNKLVTIAINKVGEQIASKVKVATKNIVQDTDDKITDVKTAMDGKIVNTRKYVDRKHEVIKARVNQAHQLAVKAHERTKAVVDELDDAKLLANGQIAKLQRPWASLDTRHAYEKRNLDKQKHAGESSCARDRRRGIVVFPAVVLDEEKDDKSCINKNRDKLVQAFCNFRDSFDSVLTGRGLKSGKHYWPNICCKEGSDAGKDSCIDPSGKIKREEIVPFALAQGGKVTFDNLYGEVEDVLKKGGHLQMGMNKVLHDLGRASGTVDSGRLGTFKARLENLFDDVSLCGPKTFSSPEHGEQTMCELLYPYGHLLDIFHTSFEQLFSTEDIKEQIRRKGLVPHAFIELMGKRQTNQMLRQAPLGAAMKAKQGMNPNQQGTCPSGATGKTTGELERWKTEYCLGYHHLDLAEETTKNVAMVYLKDDIQLEDKVMRELPDLLRFKTTDQCTSPMFQPEDISVQKIKTNPGSQKVDKEWVGLVALDSVSPGGYLRREIPQCMALPYLPRTKINVKVYVDLGNCCKETKDAKTCEKCVKPFKHFGTKLQLEYKVEVKGTTYGDLDRRHNPQSNRRRRLLQGRNSRC